MIHKRIIDAAEADPNAALAELADEVPGASVDLVERVLDEYGDPAETDTGLEEPATAQPEPEDSMTLDAEPLESREESESDTETPQPDTESADETTPADETATDSDLDTQDRSTETDTVGATAVDTDSQDAKTADTNTHEDTNTHDNENTESAAESEPAVELAELSAKRRETLRAINAYPEASQRELADMLDVAAPTISQRVRDIPDFDWRDRATFVEGLFDETRAEFDAAFDISTDDATQNKDQETDAADASAQQPPDQPRASDGGIAEHGPALAQLEDRIASLEETIEDSEAPGDRTLLDNPELVSKVVHACMEADAITTEEEHRIIEHLMS